jgi:hypothetical protein
LRYVDSSTTPWKGGDDDEADADADGEIENRYTTTIKETAEKKHNVFHTPPPHIPPRRAVTAQPQNLSTDIHIQHVDPAPAERE